MDVYKMELDLTRNLNNLRISLSNFEAGEKSVYTQIAVILRSLLTDRKPLALKAFPGIKLDPLKETSYCINEHTVLYVSHELLTKDIFNNSETKKIDLNSWLNQKVLNEEITIKELILSVADKESAHSDDFYNETLSITNNISLDGKVAMHVDFIFLVGKYIYDELSIKWKELSTTIL